MLSCAKYICALRVSGADVYYLLTIDRIAIPNPSVLFDLFHGCPNLSESMARIYYRIDRLLLLLLIVVLDFHVLFNVDAGVADVGQKRNVTVALYSHKNGK